MNVMSLLAGALVLAGCSASSSATGSTAAVRDPVGSPSSSPTVSVVASTNVYGDLVSRIGGGHVSVVSFINDPNADPHSYEASPRNQLALAGAKLVIENGGGYDDFMDKMLGATKAADRQVLNAVEISGHVAPPGGETNRHVWYDFAGMDALVDKITEALTKADAPDSADFKANADGMHQGLADLRKREDGIKAAHSGGAVAITEAVPLYLLEACGLKNMTPPEFSKAIEDSTDVPAAFLQQVLDLVKNHQVSELLYNSQTANARTDQVRAAAAASGVVVVAVTETLPGGSDFLSWMNHNLTAVEAGLK